VEYHERSKAKRGNVSSTTPEPIRSNQIPAYTSLAQQCGLLDDMYFATPDSLEEQTVEEEYRSYVTASISPPGTNILKFWEVCD
jgi:hypothetical protein